MLSGMTGEGEKNEARLFPEIPELEGEQTNLRAKRSPSMPTSESETRRKKRVGEMAQAPLAERMRPRTIAEFIGQAHLLGPGKLLRRSIEEDRLTSLVFW